MAQGKKGTGKRITKNGKRQYMHQIIWEEENNREIPEGFVIHHINLDHEDNRPENLQLMTIGEHVSLHNKIELALDPNRKFFGKNKHLAKEV